MTYKELEGNFKYPKEALGQMIANIIDAIKAYEVLVKNNIETSTENNNLNETEENTPKERVQKKYPKEIKVQNKVFETEKLKEIIGIFNKKDDGTISDQREFGYEILEEYGMTDIEYKFAVKNQDLLYDLLEVGKDAYNGETLFEDIAKKLLEDNVTYIDTNQLNLFETEENGLSDNLIGNIQEQENITTFDNSEEVWENSKEGFIEYYGNETEAKEIFDKLTPEEREHIIKKCL